MPLENIPLFAALRGRLDYLSQRERVIAENVANADVSGFTAKDIKAPSFDQLVARARGPGAIGLSATEAGHMSLTAGSAQPGDFKSVDAPDSETRMDGNSVVLEEEMMKMAESRSDYETAISLYQHALNMLKTAARKPGG